MQPDYMVSPKLACVLNELTVWHEWHFKTVGLPPGGSAGKESTCNVGHLGLIPGLGRSPGGGHGNTSCHLFLPGESHGQRSLAGYSPWNSQARILEWGKLTLLQGSFQPRDQTQVSHIAGRFFTSWTTREPKNTGVGSLPLLQGIFLT